MSSDDAEVSLLPNVFERSVENALERIASFADHSVDCAVAVPVIGDALAEYVVLGICRVWTALRRVLRPMGSALLVVDDQRFSGGPKAELAWRVVFALQKERWILRNALIGPVGLDSCPPAVGFFFVSQRQYFFDIEIVEAKYGSNPGDVVLPGSDNIVDRFVVAACPRGGRVVDLFGSASGQRRAA